MSAESLHIAAFDAPKGSFHQELAAAAREAEEERLRSYGTGRERILELEHQLRQVTQALNSEVLKSTRATYQLEQMHAQLEGVFGKDFREMSRVKFGVEIGDHMRQLGVLADRIDAASTPDDLTALKRIVKNFSIRRPAGLRDQIKQTGLEL